MCQGISLNLHLGVVAGTGDDSRWAELQGSHFLRVSISKREGFEGQECTRKCEKCNGRCGMGMK